MRGRWYRVTDLESEITFHFAIDHQQPDRLHIDVAHGARPDDAIRTFFDPHASTHFDVAHNRTERWADGWLIAYLWLDEPERRHLLVITCLQRGDPPP
jgi:hypothetical protein